MTQIRYIGRALVAGQIKLLSGLHVGAGKDTVEIGGLDNPVIKHPHTGQPYIPGSSLKGRLRFLLEWAFNRVRSDGHPWGFNDQANQTFDADDPILRIFGSPAKRERWPWGPTRLVVRDAMLDPEWVSDVLARGLPLTEEKVEVVIDRIAGKAHDRVGPRTMERVPAGAVFRMEMVFRLFETDGDRGDTDKKSLNWLLAGLSLLEQDALGGSGSRGYGRVQFEDLKVRRPDAEEFEEIGSRFRVNRFDPDTPPKIVDL